ncbi:FYVE-domain-containing protein [Rickenella mellea]|uniref:FYVE-domain-containing protein n=1 Tax=Rickenella mellea TaxID=50990 RepID=A0A4Y7PLH7_9AGAM|nr:FYVE-domain-containing protein [Rickenella mellea]
MLTSSADLTLSSTSRSSSSLSPSLASSSRLSPTFPSSPFAPTRRLEVAASLSRPNPHLAVLLPKQLWKPDSCSNQCDTFRCRKAFSLLERKHHCRKCGGIFCGKCSSRSTPLLDTTHLDFIYPPRDVPVETFASTRSPLEAARVCDECFDQIHGSRMTRSITKTPSTSSLKDAASSQSLAPRRPVLRRSYTAPSSRRSSRNSSPEKGGASAPHTPISEEPHSVIDFGELDTYPLRHHSSICKATGGGRWTPKPVRAWDGYRVPGGKAPFEIKMERKAEQQRLRKANPVIRDGDFQLRAPRETDPLEVTRPFVFATF